MPSLYERLGGATTINVAVNVFYGRILADPRISHFFEGVDMKQQATRQKAFLAMVTGGPTNYTGKHMREAHAHLVACGLNDSHVDAVIENLAATLRELGAGENDIAEVGIIANSVRHEVLGR